MFLTLFFEYAGVRNSMGKEVERKVVNKFDEDLKLIEEWIQKSIEQIDVSLKAATGIKELNGMAKIGLEFAYYRKKHQCLMKKVKRMI